MVPTKSFNYTNNNNNTDSKDDTYTGKDNTENFKLPETQDIALQAVTAEYLEAMGCPDNPPSPDTISDGIIRMTAEVFGKRNRSVCKERRFPIPNKLSPFQIGMVMLHLYPIRNISFSDSDAGAVLHIYKRPSRDADRFHEDDGIYTEDIGAFETIIRRYSPSITENGIKGVMRYLRAHAEPAVRCDDRDLIAVNNGIFHYGRKELLPFDPKYIFTAKSGVDYNPDAKNDIIHVDGRPDWNVEDWIKDLFEDTQDADIVETIWQIIGACIRPNVRWGKSAWFLSSEGNNGKGTLCHLIRNIIGRNHTSLKLSDFGEKFALASLRHALAIITDENDVDREVKKCSDIKAVITNDVFKLEGKYKDSIRFRFKGFMVQCINDMPRFSDKTESLYRRMLIVEFKKCFTGKERKYIKDEYLNDPSVLEYVLHRVLHMEDYYEIKEPECCRRALARYKIHNDPVRDFLDETLPRVSIDFLPTTLMWELYQGWKKQELPSRERDKLGKRDFLDTLRRIMEKEYPDWSYHANTHRMGAMLDKEEPLLEEYNVTSWMSEHSYANWRRRINDEKRDRHRGWERIPQEAAS